MADSVAPVGVPAPGLRIIGPGFGRTGTLSMGHALARLGFAPCDHMHENFNNPERFALWSDALRKKEAGEPIDWRPLLSGFQAIVDWPGAYFWRELVAAHPDANVVLTVRNAERWYKSIQATILPFLEGLLEEDGPELPGDVILTHTFGGRYADRAHCLAVFAAHNQAIREAIAPDRLLVFDVKGDWAPLCAFLNVPVPEGEPFPHVNDTAALKVDAGMA